MVNILAREYTTKGDPTNFVWYLLDDGKTVLYVEQADDPNYPDITSGAGEAYPLKNFIKNQNIYGGRGLIYCESHYDETDFEEIFGADASDDDNCLVVYDKEVYKKMKRAFKKQG